MSETINQRISSCIQSFVTDLNTLVRSAAVDGARAALEVGGGAVRRGRGRPKGTGTPRGPGRPPKSSAAKPGRRVRRSSAAVEATAARFLAFVKANDGKRLEEISRALQIPSANLKLPAQKLLAAKSLRTSGAKRGTKYHIASRRAPRTVAVPVKAKAVVKPARARRAVNPPKAKVTTVAAPEPSLA